MPSPIVCAAPPLPHPHTSLPSPISVRVLGAPTHLHPRSAPRSSILVRRLLVAPRGTGMPSCRGIRRARPRTRPRAVRPSHRELRPARPSAGGEADPSRAPARSPACPSAGGEAELPRAPAHSPAGSEAEPPRAPARSPAHPSGGSVYIVGLWCVSCEEKAWRRWSSSSARTVAWGSGRRRSSACVASSSWMRARPEEGVAVGR
ncbi:hypothetical protein BS78_10G143200 [Paspalum vaginatum]|nr:hypothetical protein BS78_10G143200 [Paspalum vaginatum]